MTPPTWVASTGVPTARASTTMCGKFSQLEDRSAASAARRSSNTACRGCGPRNRARPSSGIERASSWSRSRYGPSPARTSDTSGFRTTASSATGIAFCGTMRPANTSVLPSRPWRRRSSSRSPSSGGETGFGITTTFSAGSPQPSASSRSASLGMITRLARASARSRMRRRTPIRMPRASWKAPRSAPKSRQRSERSKTGSEVSLRTIGLRASAAPRLERPIIPVE